MKEIRTIMDNYRIEDDKHIPAIHKVMESLAELSARTYAYWLKKHSEARFTAYEKKVKKKLSALPCVTYVRSCKKPFGFIFTLYSVRYRFTVRKSGDLLFGACREMIEEEN